MRTVPAANGVTLGIAAAVVITVWILALERGWSYYTTPLKVRAYAEAHRVLRPSGPIGQTLGVAGAAMMLVPFAYMARKRMRGRSPASLRLWLEVHLFCGVVGPVLVTFHTSFKFNGLVSVAYWSMVIVMLSGFAGRYLYLRIPRGLRGIELSRQELEARAEVLRLELRDSGSAAGLIDQIDRLCERVVPPGARPTWSGLVLGEWAARRELRGLDRALATAALAPETARRLSEIAGERVTLLRRAAYLEKTKKAFALWHVFHLPLVFVLLAIVVVHVGVALYLGYVPFRW
jgi:hypothetical protein